MNSRTRVSSGSIGGRHTSTAQDDGGFLGHGRLAVPAGDLAADVVDHSSLRDLDQPAARIVRDAIARPLAPRRSALPAQHPRTPRSHEIAGPPRRAPAARGRAAAARRGSSGGDVTRLCRLASAPDLPGKGHQPCHVTQQQEPRRPANRDARAVSVVLSGIRKMAMCTTKPTRPSSGRPAVQRSARRDVAHDGFPRARFRLMSNAENGRSIKALPPNIT